MSEVPLHAPPTVCDNLPFIHHTALLTVIDISDNSSSPPTTTSPGDKLRPSTTVIPWKSRGDSQGHLAHKENTLPLGPPQGPRHRASVGFICEVPL